MKKHRIVWWTKDSKKKQCADWCNEKPAQQAYCNLMNTLAKKGEWHYEVETRETIANPIYSNKPMKG